MRLWRSLVLNSKVRRARKDALLRAREAKPPVAWSMHYGAIDIHPKHLAVWYIFNTEAELAEARSSGLADKLDCWTREALQARNYPLPVISQIGVQCGSSEGIRVAGGFRRVFQLNAPSQPVFWGLDLYREPN